MRKKLLKVLFVIATFLIGASLWFYASFNYEGTAPVNSWFLLFLYLFIFRILAAAVALSGLFAIVFYKHKSKKKLSIIIYLLAITIVGLALTPTQIWRVRMVKLPSNAINLSYTYTPHTFFSASSPSVMVNFATKAEKSDILVFYIKSFDNQGLCLGMESSIPEEKCFSSNLLKYQLLDQGSVDWRVNSKKEDYWGLISAYFGIREKNGLTFVGATVY